MLSLCAGNKMHVGLRTGELVLKGRIKQNQTKTEGLTLNGESNGFIHFKLHTKPAFYYM